MVESWVGFRYDARSIFGSPVPVFVAGALGINREFDAERTLGGVHRPIGAVPATVCREQQSLPLGGRRPRAKRDRGQLPGKVTVKLRPVSQ